jgi:hypothetical protein
MQCRSYSALAIHAAFNAVFNIKLFRASTLFIIIIIIIIIIIMQRRRYL